MLKRILPRYNSDLKENTAEQIEKKIQNASRYINQLLDNMLIIEEETTIQETTSCDYDDPESGIKSVPSIKVDLSDEALKKIEEDTKYELKEIKIFQ